ncbi:MAG: CBS domain-containing protein [Gammaproteobacteria bacterium]|uniref:CBS domain-containing protein n=1 Tax=Limnobacter sp. TaxID=2003368 RepID=UPI001D86B27A|nr:CBS domain-containing protein [Limnobacter sp.]MBU0783078.1 CBS domain-containing protein [Gammaproteobacteria bacterium]MBU0849665.1 CBS domain-containing protein [Gammaproteobacteria bacterium]MBU1266116.1 CBS domain-containing protein [Gammaproteobacteria bacterium]MBU1529307.1 CBS domain-containing protein [Gammaproteobacteria bacterium]MBU1779314.1 CBS domain-containing protein [Gammaproteobacteria bacterium]
MQVKEVLRVKGNTLFTVTPDTHLSDCVVTMADHDVGSLVVMDKGELAGIVTFREVIRVLAKRQKEQRTGPTPPVAEIVVREVMNPEPTVATLDMEVDSLRKLMLENHQRYLPVMDGSTLCGVISFHDVAKAVLEEQGFENKMLKGYIRDWPMEENSN